MSRAQIGRHGLQFFRLARPPHSLHFRPHRFQPTLQVHRRPASTTSSETATDARSLVTRLKNLFLGTSLVLFAGFGYLYITDTRAAFHRWIIIPLLRTVYSDAEDAHKAGNRALATLFDFGLHPRERGSPDSTSDLGITVFGYPLSNPVGISAGLDKNAELVDPLLALGPAVVEVGGVTPLPQDGNERPRVWRLPSQRALVNRYGLNSDGAEAVAMRLRQRVRAFAYHNGFGIDEEAERMVLDGEAGVPPGSLASGKLLAVQVAKMKSTPDADIEAVTADYVFCVEQLAKYADIIVVNVSSPNTPGLRGLQRVEPLTRILTGVVDAAKDVKRKTKPAVMVKVSPDEDSDEQVLGICDAIFDSRVDGVIVGNTTKSRPDPLPKGYLLPPKEANYMQEYGGYSGPQLFEQTRDLVKKYRTFLDQGHRSLTSPPDPGYSASSFPDNPEVDVPPKVEESKPVGDQKASDDADVARLLPAKPEIAPKVIFASGGITNGDQAHEVLNAGASLAMVYTAMVYGGPNTIRAIKDEMREHLNKK
ncbi:hypothetical protein BDY21DRAFT_45006 [Lineolata rhizophorae]|uniref:Dihydroorotate dehydrogenase (quinone), mitochondrial n=1 Tax=Lineolata rhizophorae TaxID=578093 RepID=A0A6A6NYP3_9PEZI|nr:hypothetical protein BDY21DRAFT_45006 [Lineolata rhizophorae]